MSSGTSFIDDIALVKKLAAINSGTNNKTGVDKVGTLIAEQFVALGFKLHRYRHAVAGDLLYLQSPTQQTDKQKVLISGHLDTVFEPETGFIDVTETVTELFGPGVNDMKSGLVITLRALRQLRNSGHTLANVGILLSPDEETGSKAHRTQMQTVARDYDAALILEGVGEDWELCHQRKGVGEIRVESFGEAAHSGHWGNRKPNAIDILARLITDIVALANLEQGTSINTGIVQGGTKINIVADHAVAQFDIRYLHAVELARIKAALHKLSKQYGATCELVTMFPPMTATNATKELMKTVSRAGKTVGRNVTFQERGSASDGNMFAAEGLAVLDGFGCKGQYHHTIKERMVKSSVKKQADLLAAAIEEITK
jgi:glutamate carboxypeptidase